MGSVVYIRQAVKFVGLAFSRCAGQVGHAVLRGFLGGAGIITVAFAVITAGPGFRFGQYSGGSRMTFLQRFGGSKIHSAGGSCGKGGGFVRLGIGQVGGFVRVSNHIKQLVVDFVPVAGDELLLPMAGHAAVGPAALRQLVHNFTPHGAVSIGGFTAQHGNKALAIGFRQRICPGPITHGGAKVQQTDRCCYPLTSRHAAARKHHGDADGLFKKGLFAINSVFAHGIAVVGKIAEQCRGTAVLGEHIKGGARTADQAIRVLHQSFIGSLAGQHDFRTGVADKYGNYWHASTMRISVNHDFERRVGLFPAGFDKDGVLYCNQNFADYPHEIPAGKFNAASQQPKWMLLSYRKAVTASSTAEGSDTAYAVDEDCRRWWSAGSDQPGEWLCVDLGRDCDVRAVQVNLADEALAVDFPADSYGDDRKTRHIETRPQISHYTVETSLDGKVWTLREDVARECSNGYYEYADGIRARYVRVTGGELPYGQTLRVSGLRVFGDVEGDRPAQADAKAVRVDALDGKISWQHIENAQGCNVRYGIAPDKLYQSWLVYDADEVTLSTLMAGQTYYVCVDSFNENGITTGKIIKMEG